MTLFARVHHGGQTQQRSFSRDIFLVSFFTVGITLVTFRCDQVRRACLSAARPVATPVGPHACAALSIRTPVHSHVFTD
jgi:hypothetical protein